MANTNHKKPNVEQSDINFRNIVWTAIVLGVSVFIAFGIGVYLFNHLTELENSRKVSEYPLVAKEMKDEESRLKDSLIKEAESDALVRLKKGDLDKPKDEAGRKQREELLAKDVEFLEVKSRIESTFVHRQDNRIFTTGFLRPALPGPSYSDADVNLYLQGTNKAASAEAIAKNAKSKIVVSRLEGVEALRPMMSGVPGWPSYAHLSKSISEAKLKEYNLDAGIKSFAKKYMEQNKEFHAKNKFTTDDKKDFAPSDSSSGRRPQGNRN